MSQDPVPCWKGLCQARLTQGRLGRDLAKGRVSSMAGLQRRQPMSHPETEPWELVAEPQRADQEAGN